MRAKKVTNAFRCIQLPNFLLNVFHTMGQLWRPLGGATHMIKMFLFCLNIFYFFFNPAGKKSSLINGQVCKTIASSYTTYLRYTKFKKKMERNILNIFVEKLECNE